MPMTKALAGFSPQRLVRTVADSERQLERCVVFLSKVLGSSATCSDPLLSEAVKSVEFELENGDYEGRAVAWGTDG